MNSIETLEKTTLVLLKAEDLQSFAENLAGKLLKNAPAPKTEEQESPISQTEAIKFIGVSRQSFYSWRRKGLITSHRLGGRIYFFKSELVSNMETLNAHKKSLK